MRLNKTDRDEFRKRVNILIPQMEKSEIVNYFSKESYPQTKLSMIIVCNLEGQSATTSWTPERKNQLKRLTNKVRGSQFGHLYRRMLRETLAP